MLRHRLPWQKPYRGTLLNKAHPLARGLSLSLLLNEATGGNIFDYVSGKSATISKPGTNWLPEGYHVVGTTGDAIDGTNLGDARNFYDYEKGTFFVQAIRQGAINRFSMLMNIENSTNTLLDECSIYSDTLNAWTRFMPNDDEDTHYWNFPLEANNLFPLGVKTDIAVTWDRLAGIISGYLNGLPYGSRAGSGTWGAADWSSGAARLQLGGNAFTHSGTDYTWDSIIVCSHIYTRVLAPAEIQQLHREPYAMFYPLNHARLVDPGIEDYYDEDQWVSFRVWQDMS